MNGFDYTKKLWPVTQLVEHTDELSVRVNVWLCRLQANGYKLTSARRALIELLASSPQALSVPQILALTEANHPSLGRATVYRTLDMLERLGLLQRLHNAQGCHCYFAIIQSSPAIMCEICSRQAYLDAPIVQMLLRLVEKQCMYQIQNYLLHFTGICADCRA